MDLSKIFSASLFDLDIVTLYDDDVFAVDLRVILQKLAVDVI